MRNLILGHILSLHSGNTMCRADRPIFRLPRTLECIHRIWWMSSIQDHLTTFGSTRVH